MVTSGPTDINPQQISIAQHSISAGRPITYFDPATGKPAGVTEAGGTFYSVGANQDLLFRSQAEAQAYAARQGQVGTVVGQSYAVSPTGVVTPVSSEQYWQQKEAKEQAAQAAFGGVRTETMLAPKGAVLDVQKAVSSGAVPGYVLESPKGKEYFLTEQAANIRALQLAPKPGEPGYHATAERPLGLYQPQELVVPQPRPSVPLFDPTTGKPNIRFEGTAPAPEFIRDAKYGLMIRQDLVKPMLPVELRPQLTTPVSEFVTYPIYMKASEISKGAASWIEGTTGYTRDSSVFTKLAVGMAEGITSMPEYGAAALVGAETVVRAPKQVTPLVWAGLVTTFGGIKTGLEEKPVETVGMFAGSALLGKLGGKVAEKAPVPRTTEVSVPVVETTQPLWRGLATKAGKPIVGLGQTTKEFLGRFAVRSYASTVEEMKPTGLQVAEVSVPKPEIVLGMPTAEQLAPTGKLTLKESYVPVTSTETQVLVRPKVMEKFGLSATEYEKTQIGQELAKTTQDVRSIYIKPYEARTGTLPAETGGVTEVFKYVTKPKPSEAFVEAFGKEKAIPPKSEQVQQLYGSFTMEAQMKPIEPVVGDRGTVTTTLGRVPGDIDVMLKQVSQEQAEAFAGGLTERLQAKGIGARVSPEKPTLIEVPVGEGTWAHALDIHYPGEPLDIMQPMTPEGAYGFTYGKKPIGIKTPTGETIPSMTLGESGLRKVGSSLTWQPATEKLPARVSPLEHRLKDIVDVYNVQRDLLESALQRGQIGTPRYEKGIQSLERWRELYPEAPWEVKYVAPKAEPIRPSERISPATVVASGLVSTALITPPAEAYKISKPKETYITPSPIGDTSIVAKYYGINPADINYFGYSDLRYSPSTGELLTSPYPYPSPYKAPSPYAPSPYGYPSPSMSPYPSPDIYPSPYPYPSPKISPYPYPSPAPSPYAYTYPTFDRYPPSPQFKPYGDEKKKWKYPPKRKEKFVLGYRETPIIEPLAGVGDLFKTPKAKTKRKTKKGKR